MKQWKELVERKDDRNVINTKERPGNESEEHFGKKLIIANELDHQGCDVTFEEPRNLGEMKGLRFDVYAKHDKGYIAFEAGDFNCRSRDLKDRLKRSYEFVDAVFWWPHKGQFMKYSDHFRAREFSTCMECGPMAFIGPIPFHIKYPKNMCSGKPYAINLIHIFEPQIWHEEVGHGPMYEDKEN